MLQTVAGHDAKDPASADRPVLDYRAGMTRGIKGLRIGVLRHLFEQDAPIPPVTTAALDAAFDVLRGLGATLEDVRIRPAQVYHGYCHGNGPGWWPEGG
jgi:aspartyl-tRNA(Asn)/glutamyl-tRNA(Gln) amidotransferase subunit A